MATNSFPENIFTQQISTSSVLSQLDTMLPLLATGPYSPTTLSMLTSLCSALKAVGAMIDMNHKDKMDILLGFLATICQDRDLDLLLRLQVLEVIELRTLGWKSNEMVDNYYKERFMQFEESRKKEQLRKEAKLLRSEKRSRVSQTNSMTSVMDQSTDQGKSYVTVNGVKLFLSSSNPEVTAAAKKLLADHFNKSTQALSATIMKYSRDDILTLATSPIARAAPVNWDDLVKDLPNVIQKPPVNSSLGGTGDSNPNLLGSVQQVSGIVGSLPLMRSPGL